MKLPAAILLLLCFFAQANATLVDLTGPSYSGMLQLPDYTNRFNGTFTNQLSITNSGTVGHPVTFLFATGAKFSAPKWMDSPIASSIPVNNIVIDGGVNGIIESTDVGTFKTFTNGFSGAGILLEVGVNVEVKNLVIRDMFQRVSNNWDCDGISWPDGIKLVGSGMTNVSVHNNCITNVGNGIVSGANGVNAYCTNLQIYSNSCVHVSWGIGSYCNGDGAQSWNTKIWANYLNPDTNWDGCEGSLHQDGIASGVPSADFVHATNHNLMIFRNFIGPDVGAQTTAAIFSETGQRTFFNDSPKIFNNVIVQAVGARSWGSGAFSMNGNKGLICNNTFVFKNGSGTAMIINASGNYQDFGLATNGVTPWTVYNNCEQGITGSIGVGGGSSIANTPPLSVTNTDYNAASSVDGNPQWWTSLYWRETVPGIAENQYRSVTQSPWTTNFDNHSYNVTNVTFVDATYSPVSGDIYLVGKGTNLTALAAALNTPELTQDFYGNARPSSGAWTIGAVELPTTPTTHTLTLMPEGTTSSRTNTEVVSIVCTNSGLFSYWTSTAGSILAAGNCSTLFTMPASDATVRANYASGGFTINTNTLNVGDLIIR